MFFVQSNHLSLIGHGGVQVFQTDGAEPTDEASDVAVFFVNDVLEVTDATHMMLRESECSVHWKRDIADRPKAPSTSLTGEAAATAKADFDEACQLYSEGHQRCARLCRPTLTAAKQSQMLSSRVYLQWLTGS